MSVFTVDLENQPGELARLCEAMAGRGINLVLSAAARENGATVMFIADDEASAETALQDAGIGYAMRPALTIRMENQPGTGAATFRKLADAGVNADLLLPVRVSDEVFFAVICVDDQDKPAARSALRSFPTTRPIAVADTGPRGPGVSHGMLQRLGAVACRRAARARSAVTAEDPQLQRHYPVSPHVNPILRFS